MLYLFVGYFVLWALTFGYLFVLGGRQKQMQRDLARLLQQRPSSDPGAPDPGAPEFS
jgi:CcmD family protein